MKNSLIKDWLDSLGSKTPTPGGGAVAALNGAIAAAQLKMVCEYTKDEEINKKASSLTQQIETFYNLAEEDSKVFQEVSQAYKTNDQQQITTALNAAIVPSRQIIKESEELIKFCDHNYQQFNPRLKADLIVTLANLKAAVRSARAMIMTNAESLGQAAPDEVQADIDHSILVLKQVDSLYEKLGA